VRQVPQVREEALAHTAVEAERDTERSASALAARRSEARGRRIARHELEEKEREQRDHEHRHGDKRKPSCARHGVDPATRYACASPSPSDDGEMPPTPGATKVSISGESRNVIGPRSCSRRCKARSSAWRASGDSVARMRSSSSSVSLSE